MITIWTYLKGKLGPLYNTVKDNSHYNDQIDTTDGRLAGNSRKSGDVAPDVADNVKALLVDEWRWAGLSDDLISIGLGIVSVESGFNPDAAAGTTSAAGLVQFVTEDILKGNQVYASRWTELVNRYNIAHPDDRISNDLSDYDTGEGSFFDVTAQAKVMVYQLNDLENKAAGFIANTNGKSPDANDYSRELIMYGLHHQGIDASWENVRRFLQDPKNLQLFIWLEMNYSISNIIFAAEADHTGVLPPDKIADIQKLTNRPWLSFLIRKGFDNQLLQCHQSFTTAAGLNSIPPNSSPLILDLDGDGIETTNVSDGAYFDHDGNGFAEKTG